MAYMEQNRNDAARDILAEARTAAASVGSKLMELRTSIYYALALSHTGDAVSALGILRDARAGASSQGFFGLEAEALLCEAMVTPAMNDSDRTAIIRCLQDSIAIARKHEAKPLLLKAETFLNQTLASAEFAGWNEGSR